MDMLIHMFIEQCMQLFIMSYKWCSWTAERMMACAGCTDCFSSKAEV